MAESGTPPTSDQLVGFIAEFVADRFRETNRGVTGAVLAEKLKQQFSNFNPKAQSGDHWLADLIRRGVAEGKVFRNPNVKHLEVFPPTDQFDSTVLSSTVGRPSDRLYVRRDLWPAFVFVTEAGPDYFNRRTFRVIRSTWVTSQTDNDLCRIDRIPATEQQAWMREFVEFNKSLSIQDAPIEEGCWWVKFPQWLRQITPDIEFQWRKFRSAKVVDRVREWAIKYDINPELVLSPVKITSRRAATERQSNLATGVQYNNDTAIREAIINAVIEMPLEDLKNLPIPVRYVLRHFRAR